MKLFGQDVYHTYGRSKKLIEQRLKTTGRQLQEASPRLQGWK